MSNTALQSIITPVSIGLQMIINSTSDGAELQMLRRWQKDYNALQEKNLKSRLVLSAIPEGYDTIAEIAFYTGINKITLYRILKRLVQIKKLRLNKVKNRNAKIEFRYEVIS